MKKIENLLNDKENFKKWLKSKAPKTKVGNVSSNYSCPIYRYLKQSETDVKNVFSYSTWDKGGNMTYNPDWVRYFIAKVDNLKSDSVNAKKALQVLEEIPNEKTSRNK